MIIHAQTSFPGLPGQDYGPAFFPIIIGSGLALCGLVFVVQGLAKRAEVPWVTFGDWVSSAPHRRNLLAVLAGLIFYILLADFLGFFITSTILLTTLMVLFGNRPTHALVMALAATFVIHFSFTNCFWSLCHGASLNPSLGEAPWMSSLPPPIWCSSPMS